MSTVRESAVTRSFQGPSLRIACFAGFFIASCFLFYKALRELYAFSLANDSASHILIVPFIAGYLIYLRRKEIAAHPVTSRAGVPVAIAAIAGFVFFSFHPLPLDQGTRLEVMTCFILFTWLGIFLSCYGFAALRKALFPACFMLLMIPLPAYVVQQATYFLQKGSTTITCWLLQLAGVPFLRDGFMISMPNLRIIVAEECSSIRSSLALAITSLLAADLFLKSTRDRIIFVLLSFPVALVKNGIRIATLSILSIYVDMSFMTGRLHHEGGFVFFAIALVIMYGFLRLFQRIEASGSAPAAPAQTSSSAQ